MFDFPVKRATPAPADGAAGSESRLVIISGRALDRAALGRRLLLERSH
ncbi:hypothetical protein [Streptomyces sp. NPDC059072]